MHSLPVHVHVNQTKTLVYSVCKKKVRKLSKQMVACDDCMQWYHYVCVGVTDEEAQAMDFKCPGGCRN